MLEGGTGWILSGRFGVLISSLFLVKLSECWMVLLCCDKAQHCIPAARHAAPGVCGVREVIMKRQLVWWDHILFLIYFIPVGMHLLFSHMPIRYIDRGEACSETMWLQPGHAHISGLCVQKRLLQCLNLISSRCCVCIHCHTQRLRINTCRLPVSHGMQQDLL